MTTAAHPLRILMISAHYPPVLNGYAIQCGDSSNALAALGHDVCVLTTSTAPLPEGFRAERRAVLRGMPPEHGRTSLRPEYFLRQLKRRDVYRRNAHACVEAARTFRPDVAIVWQFDAVGIGSALALQRAGIPVAFNVEDYSLATVIELLRAGPASVAGHLRRWLYDVDPAALDLSRLMLVSHELRRFYLDRGFPADAMSVVHNGIPGVRVAAAPPAPGPGTRLLYAGRLDPTKGVSLAIQSLAVANRTRTSRLSLDIVGTGDADYVRNLDELAQAEGVSGDVRFLGHRDRADLFAIYREYDTLLFPSVWAEPFGLTAIEAMAQGVPVIALDRGGPREIISHMIDGLLVDDESPEAYGGAMALLAGAHALRAGMAAAAIHKVANQFTAERNAAETEARLRAYLAAIPSTRTEGRRAS